MAADTSAGSGWLDNWRKSDDVVLHRLSPGELDLRDAEVLLPVSGGRPATYASILCEEVFKRSRCRWAVAPAGREGRPSVSLSVDSGLEVRGKEGYRIGVSHSRVEVVGASERGLLFGVGRLLREMVLDFHIGYGTPLVTVCCLKDLGGAVVSSPSFSMRQHQVAYRPKTNAYDSFTVEQMRQEVLDLALFGTNAIEMIPPGIDDANQSPHFAVPWLDMMRAVSEFCDSLDLDVSVWYPAFIEDESARRTHWDTVFGSLPRLDVLFVPAGDPGGREPAEFFAIVKAQAERLQSAWHPRCEVWVSSQFGLATSVDVGQGKRWVPVEREKRWLEALGTSEVRAFVDGVVYGPWSAFPITEFRQRVPSRYPLRNYPDLCHVETCEMPCDGWDQIFSMTSSREPINPRPLSFARVFDDQSPLTIGCGCYSEGVNDDVNKYIWTMLHWGQDEKGPCSGATTSEIVDVCLRQYVSTLAGCVRLEEVLVRGIYGLEENWSRPVLESSGSQLVARTSVPRTTELFNLADRALTTRNRHNWRLNLLLLRAHYDAFIMRRFAEELALEQRVYATLLSPHATMLRVDGGSWPFNGTGGNIISNAAIERASGLLLNTAYSEPALVSRSSSLVKRTNIMQLASNATLTHQYARLHALAALLFEQIGYQSSIGYGGQHRQRGAFFDFAWVPLGDLQFINATLERARKMPDLTSASDVIRKTLQRGTSEDDKGGTLSVSLDDDTTLLRTLWYASFGEGVRVGKGVAPMSSVVYPHRTFALGEDPTYWSRPLCESLATDQDELLDRLHNGEIRRSWRSWIVGVWPRTACTRLALPLEGLLDLGLRQGDAWHSRLRLRVTYVGASMFKFGGDWEELGRSAMPTRLLANGVEVHGFREPCVDTETLELKLPREAIARAVDKERHALELVFEPDDPSDCSFIKVAIPIAEVWLLYDTQGRTADLAPPPRL